MSRSCIIKTITSLYEGDLSERTLSTLTFFTHFLPSIQFYSTLSPIPPLYNHKHPCIHYSKHILALAHPSPFPPASQIRLYVRFDTVQVTVRYDRKLHAQIDRWNGWDPEPLDDDLYTHGSFALTRYYLEILPLYLSWPLNHRLYLHIYPHPHPSPFSLSTSYASMSYPNMT